jgi:hypothetical protein
MSLVLSYLTWLGVQLGPVMTPQLSPSVNDKSGCDNLLQANLRSVPILIGHTSNISTLHEHKSMKRSQSGAFGSNYDRGSLDRQSSTGSAQ